MAKEMFGDVVESSIKVGSQKWYTVPVSILVHLLIVLVRYFAALPWATLHVPPPSL